MHHDPGIDWLDREVDRGLALFREGRYLEATEFFHRARMGFAVLRADPARQVPLHVAMAPVHWAHCAFAMGRLHLAESALQRTLPEFPELPTVRFRRQSLYGERAAYEEAFARLLTRPELHFLKGYECWFNGRRAEAAAHFRHAGRSAAPFLAVAEVDHAEGLDRVQQFECLWGEGLTPQALRVGLDALHRAARRLDAPICLYRWATRTAALQGGHPELGAPDDLHATVLRASLKLGPDLASRLLEACARALHPFPEQALDFVAEAHHRARQLRDLERMERLEALARSLSPSGAG